LVEPGRDPAHDSVVHDGRAIEYAVVRSKRRRKTLSLSLDKDGQVVVAVPVRASRTQIREFVTRSIPWILRKRAALAAAPPPQRLASGASLLYLGQEVLIEIAEAAGPRGEVRLEGKCLRVSLPRGAARAEDYGAPPYPPNPPPPGGREPTPTSSSLEAAVTDEVRQETVRLALARWFRLQAARRLAEDTARWAAVMGVAPADVRVRDQRRRWGSCGTNGTIRFNFRLVMAPPDLIDYVVVHELAHLRVPNHSRVFWDEVARFMPDYAERRARLNKLGPRLTI
jgi:predicted metal-dependent hydrolase